MRLREGSQGFPQSRANHALCERAQDKLAFAHSGVRDDETAVLGVALVDEIVVEDNVEVDVARAVNDRLGPPKVGFDPLAEREQGAGLQRGLDLVLP
jgi:hypothetical protein